MNKVYIFIAIIILALGALFYFMPSHNNEDSMEKESPASTDAVTAIISTTMGDVTLELTPEDAPQTVANFVKLASEGFYNDIKFHRVIPGFMVQAGDPLTKEDSLQDRWGTGGPGYSFADEIHANNRNVVGSISMANAGPNTNGSQFFINVADNNFLDTKHTVFGNVTSGLEVVQAISTVETEGPDRPVTPVVITGITVQ